MDDDDEDHNNAVKRKRTESAICKSTFITTNPFEPLANLSENNEDENISQKKRLA